MKQNEDGVFVYLLVASLADAWIETSAARGRQLSRDVASLADAWIETKPSTAPPYPTRVASLADAWIETGIAAAHSVSESRVPRGRVD